LEIETAYEVEIDGIKMVVETAYAAGIDDAKDWRLKQPMQLILMV
jgi:hypothetical protein